MRRATRCSILVRTGAGGLDDPAPPGRAARAYSSAFPSHLPACLGGFVRLPPGPAQPVGQRCALQPDQRLWWRCAAWVRTKWVGAGDRATTVPASTTNGDLERMFEALLSRRSLPGPLHRGGQRLGFLAIVQRYAITHAGRCAAQTHPGGGR